MRGPRGADEDARTRAYPSLAGATRRGARAEDATLAGDEVEVAMTEPESRPGRPSPGLGRRAGESVGRYLLLHELGKGGMGVVWAAHDPELDRRVALKLLGGSGSPERLLREAQALARLAHPNVVAVFDAGVSEGAVWLAMELIDGMTLKTWLSRHAAKARWERILDVLMPAGEGIAAAHAAGLVHRDLKPDNVMIGADGRPRVMDFGLARADERAMEVEVAVEAGDLGRSQASLLNSDVTRAGALVGTPAYMAPEQFEGRVDARSDVFAFCVVLWEALFGERPFAGETAPALLLAITLGRVRPAPPGRKVPRWLKRIVLRGLAADAGARWPSMAALLAELRRQRARVRVLRGALVAGAVAALAAGILAFGEVQRARAVAACEAEGEAALALWPGRAEGLRRGLVASGVASPEDAASRTAAYLDPWSAGWRRARAEVCVATEVAGTMAAEVAEDAVACLEGQRGRVATILDRVEGGERVAGSMVVVVASGLEPSDHCLDLRRLERILRPPPELRAKVAALRARLDQTYTMRALGEYERGLAEAEAVRGEAAALGWGPVIAESEFMVGTLSARKSSYGAAEGHLRAAFYGAGRSGDDRLAAQSASELVNVVGHELARPKEGKEWGELARMFLARMGEADGLASVTHLYGLAMIEEDLGAPDRAVAILEEALAIETRTLGADHLSIAGTLSNLANPLSMLGRHAEARAHLERALALREAAFGPESQVLTGTLNNLALVASRLGDTATALALNERTLRIFAAGGDTTSLKVSNTLNNLSSIYSDLERFDEAVATGEQVLAIRERELGPDHPATAGALNNLAIAEMGRGALDTALAMHLRALAIRERALGPENPEVARSLTNIGEVREKKGELDLAAAALERALAIRTAAKVAPQSLAYTQFVLGRVYFARGEREEGLALVEAAAGAWKEAGDPRVADVDAWRAKVATAAGTGSTAKKKAKKTAKKTAKK